MMTPGVPSFVLFDLVSGFRLLFDFDFLFSGKYVCFMFCHDHGVDVAGMMVSQMTASDLPPLPSFELG